MGEKDYFVDKKEVGSMNAIVEEHTGYKRLNFSTLKFTDKKINQDSTEKLTPIKWSDEVLSGKKKIVIKQK